MDENSWPGGKRHAMFPDEHKDWNESHYPGTRQLCSICGEPTGRCEDDVMRSLNGDPLCEDCFIEEENSNIEKNIAKSITA